MVFLDCMENTTNSRGFFSINDNWCNFFFGILFLRNHLVFEWYLCITCYVLHGLGHSKHVKSPEVLSFFGMLLFLSCGINGSI